MEIDTRQSTLWSQGGADERMRVQQWMKKGEGTTMIRSDRRKARCVKYFETRTFAAFVPTTSFGIEDGDDGAHHPSASSIFRLLLPIRTPTRW